MERESNNMCRLFTPNWENSSMDQNDPFESALSSMVSSPTASNANCSNINGCENIVLRELIGRLGSICSSREISPFNGNGNGNNSSSCYSTPLNSPPKLHLSSNERERANQNQNRNQNQNHHFLSLPTLAPPLSADPAFAERAARFSSFANTKLCGSDSNSRENSTVCDQQITNDGGDPNPRKRKAAKGKGKQTIAPASENSEEWRSKRSKSQEENEIMKEKKEKVCGKEKNSKDIINGEPQKDYIHVRARRGQATDAHSLAERVRREKISERMKVLQDLVPGCNKVTGKAVMLDEIINYVQSLQRQVEFLSMKLSTVNPRMDFNMEALLSKDMFHSMPHNIYPSSDSYPFQSQPNNVDAALGRNQGLQLPPMDNFGDAASQVSSLWEDDLHSIVQMGFGTQNFQGIVPTSQMKVEL